MKEPKLQSTYSSVTVLREHRIHVYLKDVSACRRCTAERESERSRTARYVDGVIEVTTKQMR